MSSGRGKQQEPRAAIEGLLELEDPSTCVYCTADAPLPPRWDCRCAVVFPKTIPPGWTGYTADMAPSRDNSVTVQCCVSTAVKEALVRGDHEVVMGDPQSEGQLMAFELLPDGDGLLLQRREGGPSMKMMVWREIEQARDLWGHPLDYATMVNEYGLSDSEILRARRRRKNVPHGNRLSPDLKAKAHGFVATDVGMICFKPTTLEAGQYHKGVSVNQPIKHYPSAHDAPKNVGGYHGCVIETGQPGSTWHILVLFIDAGPISRNRPKTHPINRNGPVQGCRPHLVILAHPDLLIHTVPNEDGKYNERRALTKAADIVLPAGISRILLSDTANDWNATSARNFIVPHRPDPSFPPIMTCAGDGYFPVYVLHDADGMIRKIVVLFWGGLADFHHEEGAMVARHPGHKGHEGEGGTAATAAAHTSMEDAARAARNKKKRERKKRANARKASELDGVPAEGSGAGGKAADMVGQGVSSPPRCDLDEGREHPMARPPGSDAADMPAALRDHPSSRAYEDDSWLRRPRPVGDEEIKGPPGTGLFLTIPGDLRTEKDKKKWEDDKEEAEVVMVMEQEVHEGSLMDGGRQVDGRMKLGSARAYARAVICYEIAAWCERRGDLPRAQMMLQLAIETLGPEEEASPLGLELLDALATVTMRIGESGEAVALYEKSLRLRRDLRLALDPSELCGSLHRLGALYLMCGETDKAMPLLKETVELAREQLRGQGLDVAVYVGSLSEAHERAGEPHESYLLALQADQLWAHHVHTLLVG